jgi:hypothetical protein
VPDGFVEHGRDWQHGVDEQRHAARGPGVDRFPRMLAIEKAVSVTAERESAVRTSSPPPSEPWSSGVPDRVETGGVDSHR